MMWQENIEKARMKLSISTFYVERRWGIEISKIHFLGFVPALDFTEH